MSKNKRISWILDFINRLPNDKERVKCIVANQHVLGPVLKYTFDPNIEWLLPEGAPTYVPGDERNTEVEFYKELKKLYLFVKGGNDNLAPLRREQIFVNTLSTIHPEDAKLLLAMKERTLPYKHITKKLTLKALPGLF